MKLKRKFIAWLTAAAVMAGMMPGLSAPVFAAGGTAVNGSDALAALGIDTSVAPDGFDASDTVSNPYGRSTIEVTPVKELYTVGMKKIIPYEQQINKGNQSVIKVGELEDTERADGSAPGNEANELVSTLYGNEKWGVKTTGGIMSDPAESSVSKGRWMYNGKYAVIASGTYAEGSTSGDSKGYLSGLNNKTNTMSSGFGGSTGSDRFGMSDVAAGNFDKNTKGYAAQTVMAYTRDHSHTGGIYLKFGDATTGNYGDPKEVLKAGTAIGNESLMIHDAEGSDQKAENFAENPYQLKNYLQVATGDWNGDGLDEVAVYVPEVGNSRIVVYALQTLQTDNMANAYKDPGKWKVAWTYHLKEGSVVSNMISLVSADVNQDGIDDLACTWGYYYGPEQNAGSRAVVMFGGKGTEILKKSQEFGLKYGTSDIVRASFVFGDMTGSGDKSLILCGQADSDLKAGNTSSRYVAAYNWNGTQFEASSSLVKNFDLFGKSDGAYIYSAMDPGHRPGADTDHFYSLPLCAADTAMITRPIGEDGGDLLYFDSLIIKCSDEGLDIAESWDISKAMQGNGALHDYVEYSAESGDMTGQTGAAALAVMTQTLSSTSQKNATYTQQGKHNEAVYKRVSYYKNWWHKLWKKKSYRWEFDYWKEVQDAADVKVEYTGFDASETFMTVIDRSQIGSNKEYYSNRRAVDSSMALCMANTDNDSSIMNYTGKHYYTYTDPKILAVLASPPYFKDLLDRDDLSGNYPESTTTYSSSTGSGTGSVGSTTIKAGVYVSYEYEIKIFGVPIGKTEAEMQVTGGFTWETEKTSTLEQTVTYSATSGEDKVAFYSIPMEVYEYISYVPNGKGGYDEVTTTVNIPHEASVRLLSLDAYEAIASDYSVLPKVSETVLTHTLGDPTSYPSSLKPYEKNKSLIASYVGDPAKVGFTSAGGGSTISQEIAMSTEKSNAYIGVGAIEGKVGAGAGGLTVGVVAGFEGSGGKVEISTSGSSFSGELQDMPAEAEAYGYAMNWRIFCYKYDQNGVSFPVVNYIVSDAAQPASLPEDFSQDIAATTDKSVTLTWSYDKMVSGFQIYRYYEFPDGSGSYRLQYVPFREGKKNSDGTYSFSYTDKGLNPYTEYSYQIQTESAYKPNVSIYSEPLECRTKTSIGYPEITVDGLDEDGLLPVYPDKDNATATVSVTDEEKYNGNVSYQWQRLVNNVWTDISGAKSASYTIANASASDEGRYRCRVNVIYYDKTAAQQYHISAYSQDFAAAYSKRTPAADLQVETGKSSDTSGAVNTLHAQIKLHSKNKDSITAPSGNVVFRISGTDFEKSISVPLAQSSTMDSFNGESKYFATATLDMPDTERKLSALAEGAYTVSAYYSGDTVFKDLETEYNDLVLIGDNVTGYQLKLRNKAGGSSMTMFSYSEDIYAELLSKTGNDPLAPVENANVKYILLTESQIKEEAAELAKPESQQDKTKIFDASKATPAGADGILSFKTSPYAGEYTLRAFDGEKNAAESAVSIKRKSVSIYIEDSDNISANDVDKNLPAVKCDEVSADELAEFKLGFSAVNSAGNTAELKSGMEPGNYIVTPGVTEATPDSFYNNYEPVYRSARYTVIGLTYRISVSAADYTDPAGARPVGKVEIIGNEQAYGDYPSGTHIQFRAIPNAGYQIDHWVYKVGERIEEKSGDSIDPQRLSVETEAAQTTVTAYFKPKTITLKAYTDKGGSVKCTSNENFTSGAYVSNGAEFTFMAEPAEGYHFRDWSVSEVGQSTVTHKGTQNDDGTNTLDITVGNENISVRANFERDSYKLTLTGDIKAHYTRQNNAGADVEINVENGAEIVGDTVITVTPKTGYQAAENAVFVVNGEETTESSVYSFELKRDTEVSLDTVRNAYTVSASAENGSVAIKTGTDTVDGDTVENVPGGTAVSFTAHAERGFRLKGWKINGTGSKETGDVLTIPALGENIEAEAEFEAIGSFTATAAVTPAERGRMLYTLKDIYGDIVGEEKSVMPDEGLMVYEGESILFRAEPDAGYMIEQWELDGKYDVSSSKNYPGGEVTVSDNINVTAYVKSASSYGVSWFTPNPDETTSANGTLSAVADGDALDGNTALVPGGSSIEFKAEPDGGHMLDYWTVTDGDGTADENTERYMDADGQICVDPVLKIDGLSGHKTVRAYFTEESKSDVILRTGEAGNAGITYATPLKHSDNGEIADLKSVSVRSGGKTVFWLEPAADYFAKSGDIESDIKNLINSDASVTVKYAAGKYTVTVANLKEDLEFAMSNMFEHHETYEITVPAGVTSDKVKAREGDIVTLTVTPENGKKLSSLSLSGGAVLNEDVSSSTLVYTFKMPAGPVAVSVTFRSESSGGGGGGGGGSGGGSGGSTPADPKPSDPKPADPQPGNTPGGTDTSKDRLEIAQATDINGKKLEIQNNKDGSVTVNTGSPESKPIILDVKNAGAGAAAYVIKPDGTEELIRDSVLIDGKLYMHATDGMKIKAADAGVGFDDVDADSWSADAVAFVSGHGLFNGTGKGIFSPKAEMTREMLMTVIARLNGADTEGDALAKGMAWAVKNGISDGSGPKASITREQIVTMLYRNAGKPAPAGGISALDAFSDKEGISGYAADAMAWAVEKGIIKGMGGSEAGKIAPKANATREQVAQMMLNYAVSIYR